MLHFLLSDIHSLLMSSHEAQWKHGNKPVQYEAHLQVSARKSHHSELLNTCQAIQQYYDKFQASQLPGQVGCNTSLPDVSLCSWPIKSAPYLWASLTGTKSRAGTWLPQLPKSGSFPRLGSYAFFACQRKQQMFPDVKSSSSCRAPVSLPTLSRLGAELAVTLRSLGEWTGVTTYFFIRIIVVYDFAELQSRRGKLAMAMMRTMRSSAIFGRMQNAMRPAFSWADSFNN